MQMYKSVYGVSSVRYLYHTQIYTFVRFVSVNHFLNASGTTTLKLIFLPML